MANIFDYITWRGDLSFLQSPFNEVDNLILSRLSYFPMDDIVSESFTDSISIARVSDEFFSNYEFVEKADIIQKEDVPLLKALAGSNRFGSLRILGYVNKLDYNKQKQFSCLTIMLDEHTYFISYRGTDDTLVGWKEDFNMAFMPVIPAQKDALNYFENAANTLQGQFYLGGHSKGGNLAVYASVFSPNSLKPRIIRVFNNDGPGFYDSLLTNEKYQEMRGRIHTYVPQSSIIGMLLEHEDSYAVVQSTQRGLLQHDLYTWEIICTSFVHLDTVDSDSRFLNHTLKEWLEQLTLEKREVFLNTLYDVLNATEARTFQEMDASWLKNAQIMIGTYSKIDKATKRLMNETLKSLFHVGGKNLHYLREH